MAKAASTRPNVVFIIPRVKINPFSMLNSLPVGPALLAAKLKKLGYGVKIYNEARVQLMDRRGRITAPGILNADIACISIMTPNANRGYLYADMLRSMGKKVVMGGIHASIMPEEASPHADAVVTGEGENVIDKLESLRGIVNAGVVDNMDDLPVPDFSLSAEMPSIADRLYGRSIPLSTIRGCPFNCDFCSVGSVYGRRVRSMSPRRLGEEVEQRVAEAGGAKNGLLRFFYCDDTYSLLKEKRREQHEIIRAIESKYRARVSLCIQDRADAFCEDEDYVKDMSGIVRRVMLGIEQMDDEFLKSHNKGMKISQIKSAVRLLQKYKIGIHAFCIVSPDITDAAVNNTLSYLTKSGIETAQFTMLTPLPGTLLYEKTKDTLVGGWDNYHSLSSVFKQTQEGFVRKTKKMYCRFYSLKKILNHAFRLQLPQCLSSLYGRFMGYRIFKNSRAGGVR